MRKWFLISGAGAVVGYVAVYFALDRTPVPEPEAEQPAATAPAAPVVLAHVVEVTDLDPLLDPPPPEVSTGGVPFEASEPLERAAPVGVPAPIPPAVEMFDQPTAAEVAPFPHDARVRPALDGLRASWYGEEVFHRQLYDWLREPRPLYGLGVGYFF
jgi:hypothetical protein